MWQCCQKNQERDSDCRILTTIKKAQQKKHYKGIKRGITPVENCPKVFTNVNQ